MKNFYFVVNARPVWAETAQEALNAANGRPIYSNFIFGTWTDKEGVTHEVCRDLTAALKAVCEDESNHR